MTRSPSQKGTRSRRSSNLTHWLRHRTQAGLASRHLGLVGAGKLFGLSKQLTLYWRKRVVKREPKVYGRGGIRGRIMDKTIESYIKDLLRLFPQLSLDEIRSSIWRVFHVSFSNASLSRYLNYWGYSRRLMEKRDIRKYEKDNILSCLVHYLYVTSISKKIGFGRIKFLDESHFSSRKLFRERGSAPRNKIIKYRGNISDSRTYNVTLLTNLDQNSPISISMRKSKNDQYSFLCFMLKCLNTGKLKHGDFLILDNASVHRGKATFPLINKLLLRKGVRLLFLPRYSPELNPCELVFSTVKHRLRCNRDPKKDFLLELVKAFTKITHITLKKMFGKCIFNPN